MLAADLARELLDQVFQFQGYPKALLGKENIEVDAASRPGFYF
jgi:hypothetical protein